MAAKLERDARHRIRRLMHQLLSDRDRSGEAHFPDDGRGDQGFADHLRLAVDQLGNTLGNAGIGQRAEHLAGAAGRFLWRTRDDGAARGERRGDLFRQQVDREIPRRESRGRADRLTDDDRPLPGRAHQRAAIVALDLFGVPVEHRRRSDHFGPRLDQRLALLLRQHPADMVSPFDQQRGGAMEDRGAFFDIGRAPHGPGAVSGGKRLLEIGRARQRD